MNKEEFMATLQRGLVDVPAEERVAAIQYYTEYLDDAGPEREAEALEELGDPDNIAAEIRADSEREGWTPPERTHEARPVAAGEGAKAAPETPAEEPAGLGTQAYGTAQPAPGPVGQQPDGMWGGSYPVIAPTGESGQNGRPPMPPDYQAGTAPPPAEEQPAAQPQWGQQAPPPGPGAPPTGGGAPHPPGRSRRHRPGPRKSPGPPGGLSS